MKKNLKSQLMAAVSMLVVAAVALTGATYAWFTAVANPEVKNIDLYVRAADAMLLSSMNQPNITTANNWNATLYMDDIKDAMQTLQGVTVDTSSTQIVKRMDGKDLFPEKLYNVSLNAFSGTAVGATYGIANFRGRDYNTDGTFKTYTTRETDKGYENPVTGEEYAQFELWAKSTNNGYVYLDEQSLVRAYNETAKAIIDYLATVEDSATAAFIASTVRVAFVPITYAAGSLTSQATASPTFTGKDYLWTKAVIWEPNSDKHLPTAQGGQVPTASQGVKVNTNGVTGTNLDNETTGATLQTTYDFLAGKTNGLAADTNKDKKIMLFDLAADTMQNFAVFIWVEGADGDTVNAVAKNWFRTYLRFGQETGVKMSGDLYA